MSKIKHPAYLVIAALLVVPCVVLLVKTAPQWIGGGTEVRQIEKSAQADPTFESLVNLGMTHIKNNEPEKSLEPLEKAKALNPNSAVVYNNLGVAYILLKRLDEGIAACRKAIELDPSFQLAKNNLNWGLSEKEKLKDN